MDGNRAEADAGEFPDGFKADDWFGDFSGCLGTRREYLSQATSKFPPSCLISPHKHPIPANNSTGNPKQGEKRI